MRYPVRSLLQGWVGTAGPPLLRTTTSHGSLFKPGRLLLGGRASLWWLAASVRMAHIQAAPAEAQAEGAEKRVAGAVKLAVEAPPRAEGLEEEAHTAAAVVVDIQALGAVVEEALTAEAVEEADLGLPRQDIEMLSFVQRGHHR